MNHNNKGKILDRKKEARGLLLRGLVTQLFIHEKIKTTLAKAKVVRPIAEKIITKGKNNNLATFRVILKYVLKEDAAKKVVKDISPRYKERAGGYTRIVKLGLRKGDGAEMAVIELV
ncbi:50S ribosomal protein L17 [Candidatus Falkowbacteria bacterium RBG_13_39_14]|uniref:Large ribosomal subunit protein bL17 n=1 Tax=Candidatus Falkowbacteria bacterium RBG_13_39_14 TaxID=1797985 RepID=A0A1F5S939_9BACT|nr:MAG: 50S ribosomal protein L17 [Candidatus Falkowbacteria bacterium RBG_13_39_14]